MTNDEGFVNFSNKIGCCVSVFCDGYLKPMFWSKEKAIKNYRGTIHCKIKKLSEKGLDVIISSADSLGDSIKELHVFLPFSMIVSFEKLT